MPEFLQDNGIWEVWARGKEPLVHRPTRLTWLLCPAVGERYSDSPSHPSQNAPILQSDDFLGDFSSNRPSLSHSAKNSPFLVCCFNEEQREFHTHILDAPTQASVLRDFPPRGPLSGAPSRVSPLNTTPRTLLLLPHQLWPFWSHLTRSPLVPVSQRNIHCHSGLAPQASVGIRSKASES